MTTQGAESSGMVDKEGLAAPFQARVAPWLTACFGEMVAGDREERNHRFLEEALELVQACGCSRSEAPQLVDYVFGRGVGEPSQEVGGVMATLAGLCLANGLDMHQAGERELARVWTKIAAIREKQAAKPKHSLLPDHQPIVHGIDGEDVDGEASLWLREEVAVAVAQIQAGDFAAAERTLLDAVPSSDLDAINHGGRCRMLKREEGR